MGDDIRCQAPLCGRLVRAYRQCGAGCALVISYCVEHGGDDKAMKEMKQHIQQQHA